MVLPAEFESNNPSGSQREVRLRQTEASHNTAPFFQEGWNLIERATKLFSGIRNERGAASEQGPFGKLELCGTGKTPEDALDHFLHAPIKTQDIDFKKGTFKLELEHKTWVDFPDNESLLLQPKLSGNFSLDKDGTIHLTKLDGIELFLSLDSRKGSGWKAESLTMRKPDADKKVDLEVDVKTPFIPNQNRSLDSDHYDKSIAFFRKLKLIEAVD